MRLLYREVFWAYNGPGPHPCSGGCGQRFTVHDAHVPVHHLNHDRGDSSPGNLVVICHSCHGKHHRSVQGQMTQASRDKLSRSLRAARARKGSNWYTTPAAKAELAVRLHARWRCVPCGLVSDSAGIARHQRATFHDGKEKVAMEVMPCPTP